MTRKGSLFCKVMFTPLKRIIKFGWQGFWRNKELSGQVIFIMAVAVLLGTCFFVAREIGFRLIEEAENKVDVAIYFKKEAPEESIFAVQEQLTQLKEQIKTVDYVSKTEALENFRQRHKAEPPYLSALEEVEGNPFLASLDIKATGPQYYAFISSFLEEGIFRNLIDKISYHQNKEVIDKLFSITSKVKTWGLILSLVLGVLVVLITLNTVKLSIAGSEEEIATMKLVGAPNWLVRGPFLVQGILYGVFAVLVVDSLLLATFYFLNTQLEGWFLSFNILKWFQGNFLTLVLAQLALAIMLGVISSSLAVSRYLKI